MKVHIAVKYKVEFTNAFWICFHVMMKILHTDSCILDLMAATNCQLGYQEINELIKVLLGALQNILDQKTYTQTYQTPML